jgi:hypothetical protein
MKAIKFIIFFGVLSLISSFSFSQGVNVAGNTNIDTIYATAGNKFEVIYKVFDAEVPVLEFMDIQNAQNPSEKVEWVLPPFGKLPACDRDLSPRSLKDSFSLSFIPKKAGIYNLTLRACDAKMGLSSKGCTEPRISILKVQNPKLVDNKTLDKIQNICEKEYNDINFATYGFPDSSLYKIVVKVNGIIDTIKNPRLIIEKNSKYRKGSLIDAIVLYNDKMIYYYDEKSGIIKEAIYKIMVQDRKVAIVWSPMEDNAEIPVNAGISFTAKKCCNDFVNGEAVDDITDVTVADADGKKSFTLGKINANNGYYNIPLKLNAGKRIPKTGIDIIVTLNDGNKTVTKPYTITKEEKR